MSDFVTFDTGYKANGDFGVCGRMPPIETFVPGDIVCWHDKSDLKGLIVAAFKQNVLYEGMGATLTATFRNTVVAQQKIEIDFYTVLWNTGVVRTAGAHATFQLKKVA